MSENIYPKGLYVNKPHSSAPDFVKGKISIKVADLHEWLNNNQGLANDKGYINLAILDGKEDWYCKVDNYKPKEQKQTPPDPEYYSPEGGDVDDTFVVEDDSIPF